MCAILEPNRVQNMLSTGCNRIGLSLGHNHANSLGKAIACFLVFSSAIFGQQTDEPKKQNEYFHCLAKLFDAKLASGVSIGKPNLLLNWTIGSSWQGSTYVWSVNQKPVLIGCFLAESAQPDRRRVLIEMHALADELFMPIELEAKQKHRWDPLPKLQSKIVFEKGPKPSSEARTRRTQMRQIAESLTAMMYEDRHVSDNKEQLRLLPTPLYRYPEEGENDSDGSIFAYVRTNGTDPEFLLSVEYNATLNPNCYIVRPIRFCTRRLELSQSKDLLWSCDEYDLGETKTSHKEPYLILTLLEASTQDFEMVRSKMLKQANP